MIYYTLLKNNFKNIITIKSILITLILIIMFIFSSIQLINTYPSSNNMYLLSILNGSLSHGIQGKFIYILNQFIIISLFGNYLYLFIKDRLQYHIIRIGSIYKWFISLILTTFVMVLIYYLLLVTVFFMFILFFNKNIYIELKKNLVLNHYFLFFLNTFIISILNSIFYLALNTFLVFLIKNNIFPYIIILIIQTVTISIFSLNLNYFKFIPFFQVFLNIENSLINIYTCLIVSISILFFLSKKCMEKNLFNLINMKET